MIYFIFIIFTILLLMLFFYQVQYFIVFDPKKHRKEKLDDRYTILEIKAEDGTLLEGVEFTPKDYKSTIFYIGGKSQDSVGLIHKLSHSFEEYRILTFNYRGYGNSKGMPNEKNLYGDALYVAKKFKEIYGDFDIVGFSIGSSVAAYVASKVKVKRVLLLGAFDSVFNLFKRRHAPSFLIRYNFDTSLHVKDIDANVYLVSSVDDNIVPIENVYKLKNNIKNLVEYKELSSYNHDEILFSDETIKLVKRVLN